VGNYSYLLEAEDKNGLKSKPSQTIIATLKSMELKPSVENLHGVADRSYGSIRVEWTYKAKGVQKIEVFRAEENEAITLYRSLVFDAIDFEDENVKMNKTYKYRLRVVFKDGTQSALSRELKIGY
jgi:hypothetical protein